MVRSIYVNLILVQKMKTATSLARCASLFSVIAMSHVALAADIPGGADASKLHPEDKNILDLTEPTQKPEISLPKEKDIVPAPEYARKISLVLKGFNVNGVTAFSSSEIEKLYKHYIDKEVTLDIAWKIASDITKLYRDKGYFISLAYVPQQSVKDGIIKVNVIESYIGVIELTDEIADNYVVRSYINDLRSQKPISYQKLESFLLRLNDLHGLSFRAVLASVKPDVQEVAEYNKGNKKTETDVQEIIEEGAVKLALVPSKKKWNAKASVDNTGSVFLGPQTSKFSFSNSFVPLHQTSMNGAFAFPIKELARGGIDHSAYILPNLRLNFGFSATASKPGDYLKNSELKNKVHTASLGLGYTILRQRAHNLGVRVGLDATDSERTTLGVLSSKDKIRALNLSASYDVVDRIGGYSLINVKYTKGLNGALGGSKRSDDNLSRVGAVPDFNKFNFDVSRLQKITDHFKIFGAVIGQYSRDVLYTNEEFGYGGSQIGRAYDANDLTGIRGIAGTVELRYEGLPKLGDFVLKPYAFYDAGSVVSYSAISSTKTTKKAYSSGLGIRGLMPFNVKYDVGLAFPISHKIAYPIYKSGEKAPRIMFSFSREF